MLPLQNIIRIALWKYLFFFHWLSRNLLYSSLTSLNSLKIHQVKILSLTNISQWKDRICSCNMFGWGFLFSRLWVVGQFLLCFLGGIFYSAVCFFVCLVVWSIVFGCGFWRFFVSTNPWRIQKSQEARFWNRFCWWEFCQWLPQDQYFTLVHKLRVNKWMSVPWKCKWNKSE